MKTLHKILMAMFAVATIGMTVSCQKSDSSDDGYGDVNASIVGTWKVDAAYLDNNIIPQESLNMSIQMNENGSGELLTNGMQLPIAETHFTWTLNGTSLNITLRNTETTLTYTVTKLTATACTIMGTVVPGMPNMTGQVRLDMSRNAAPEDPQDPQDPQDPEDPQNPEDPAAFPGGTSWSYSQSIPFTYNNHDLNVTITGTLSFAATGNTGSLNVQASTGNPMFDQLVHYNETINITAYTYDETTKTGTLTGAVPGAIPATFNYIYNEQENAIHIAVSDVIDSDVLNLYSQYIPEDAEINIPEELILTRVQ